MASVNKMLNSSSYPPFKFGILSYVNNVQALTENSNYLPAVTDNDYEVFKILQQKAQDGQLIEMNRTECIEAYLADPQILYRNLVVVSENATSTSSVVWMEDSSPFYYPTKWICRYRGAVNSWQGSKSDLDCDPRE